MTFDEAFQTGCRFIFKTQGSDDVWWVKYDFNHIEITITDGTELITPIINIEDITLRHTETYRLHPDDEYKLNFNKKLENIIK